MTIDELATKHGVTVKFAEMMMGVGVTHQFIPDEGMTPGRYRPRFSRDVSRPHKEHRVKAGKHRRRHSHNDVPSLV